MTTARYAAPSANVAEGWRLERLTAPSRLFGANGLRTGPDGRIYIAQVTGSQISALDLGGVPFGSVQVVAFGPEPAAGAGGGASGAAFALVG